MRDSSSSLAYLSRSSSSWSLSSISSSSSSYSLSLSSSYYYYFYYCYYYYYYYYYNNCYLSDNGLFRVFLRCTWMSLGAWTSWGIRTCWERVEWFRARRSWITRWTWSIVSIRCGAGRECGWRSNLLLRRKEIQREYPQEHQYLQYLLDKSRLDDQQPAEKTQNKPLSDK